MKFSELFENAANRAEVVCTFLALLELIRLKQLVCVQPEPFAEIEISRPVGNAPQAGSEPDAAPVQAPAAETGGPLNARHAAPKTRSLR